MRKQWLAILLIVISTCFIFIFTSRRIFLQKQWFFRTFQAFRGSPKTNVRAFFHDAFAATFREGHTVASEKKLQNLCLDKQNTCNNYSFLVVYWITFPIKEKWSTQQSLRDNNKDKLCCSYNSKYLCHNIGKSQAVQGAKIEHAHRQDMQVSLQLIQGQVGCRRY